MSKSMPHAAEWTYAEYARLPDDGNRYEVIDGEVCVTPAPGPKHQHAAANLFVALRAYVQRNDLGIMLWDVDLLFQPGQFLRPDMLFVPKTGMSGITDRGVESRPDLVVEVLSPHSKRIDRVKKPPRYRDFGVREYWVMDPTIPAIDVFFSAGESKTEKDVLVWHPAPEIESLRLVIPEVITPLRV